MEGAHESGRKGEGMEGRKGKRNKGRIMGSRGKEKERGGRKYRG